MQTSLASSAAALHSARQQTAAAAAAAAVAYCRCAFSCPQDDAVSRSYVWNVVAFALYEII